ncbi:hypothetical protein [Flavilitoribacter nigricans]|nr:hypothetical protein [Flavilitoribacter nigricans]
MKKRISAEKRHRARELYVDTDLSQGEIAGIVGVSPKTMSNWVNDDNQAWKRTKSAKSITKDKVIASWYRQLDELNKSIANREVDKRYPTPAETDQMVKIAASIDKLERSYNFAMYHQAIDELTDFLTMRDQQAAAIVSKYALDFLKAKSRKLNG